MATNRLTAALCAVALAPTASATADTGIDLESPALADCTAVSTQYAGGQFVTGQSAEGYPSYAPPVRSAAGARSGTHFLQLGVGCSLEPGVTPGLAFRPSQTRAAVSLYARQEGGTIGVDFQLRALDASGARIDTNGTTYVALAPGTGTYTQLEAHTADNTNRIATVALVGRKASESQTAVLRVDDIQLTDGSGGAAPDFALGPSPVLVLPQGGYTTIYVPITRYNGSSGFTNYTLTNVPPGVSADVAEIDATTLRIRAGGGADAPPGAQPAITVTGTPGSSGVAPGPRSTAVPVTVTPTGPSLTISEPAEGLALDRVPNFIYVRGSYASVRRGPTFCVTVSPVATAPAAPASCADTTTQTSSGTYRLTISDGLAPGPNYITVFARDSAGYTASATRLLQIAGAASGIDLRITGVEITQDVQSPGLAGGLAFPSGAVATTTTPYAGVQLVARRQTFVRVYANTNVPARSDGRTPAVTARLRVTRNGAEVPGSPFLPLDGPEDLAVGGLYARDADRADSANGYLFALPASVAERGPLVLDALINDATNPIVECATCAGNDELRVTNVRFRPMKTVEIFPLRYSDDRDGHREPTVTAPEAFALAATVSPFPLLVHDWVGEVNLNADWRDADAELARWRADHPTPGPDDVAPRPEMFFLHWLGDYELANAPNGEVMAVGNPAGGMTSAPWHFCCAPPRTKRVAVATQDRPLTSIAHEFGHIQVLPHADRGDDCGGNSNGQVGDTEWPDPRGSLVGVGFNPVTHQALPAFRGGVTANYDYMSYCASTADNNSWISSRNWNLLVDRQADGPAARRSPRADVGGVPGPGITVIADMATDGSGATITSVQPTASGAQDSEPGTPYELVVLGPGGRAISTTSVAASPVHGDDPGSGTRLMVVATVPAGAAAAGIELRRADGALLASRTASAHAPVIVLKARRRGTRVGKRGTLLVRWRASDEDSDDLRFSVEQAAGARGPFRLVSGGLSGRSARIPATLLTPSPHARIRVRAFDGFRESTAVSGPVRIAPRGPAPVILAPAAKASARADAVLSVEGSAFDSANRVVPDRRLIWRVDGRTFGRGRQASVSGLRPGRRRITLTAVDAAGHRGTAQRFVRVGKVTPRLLTLRVPKVGRTARSFRLTLAASVPSTVGITGSGAHGRARLGIRNRTVRVRMPRGATPLALALRLRGGGRQVVVRVTVER